MINYLKKKPFVCYCSEPVFCLYVHRYYIHCSTSCMLHYHHMSLFALQSINDIKCDKQAPSSHTLVATETNTMEEDSADSEGEQSETSCTAMQSMCDVPQPETLMATQGVETKPDRGTETSTTIGVQHRGILVNFKPCRRS